MNKKSLYSRLDMIEWMLSLPKGENDSKIESVIDNCKSLGKNKNDIINFLNLAFKKEVDSFIEWQEEINSTIIK
jgi:hypothetical protein